MGVGTGVMAGLSLIHGLVLTTHGPMTEVWRLAEARSLPIEERWKAISALEPHRLTRLEEDRLSALAKDPAPMVRAAAIRMIGLKKISRELPLVHAALSDPTLVVRDEAVRALFTLGTEESGDYLTRSFRDARNEIRGNSLYIREYILIVLAEVAPSAFPTVAVEALQSDSPRVRERAIKILAEQFPSSGVRTAQGWIAFFEKKSRKNN